MSVIMTYLTLIQTVNDGFVHTILLVICPEVVVLIVAG